jgi:D-3-phosphoglycerate dehydrogenase
MARVLVTEEIAAKGLDLLRDAGHDVDVQIGLDEAALAAAIKGAQAIIIRSATTVTAELLVAGDELKIVGRAGIGLDNVDVDAATDHNVLVANAPFSNAITAAEHTLAMLLAQARNIAHAHAALIDGRWERSKWNGVELAEKTLGIIGLGRIGGLVAARAKAFDMNLIAYDPFVPAERAAEMGCELVDLETLISTSDFVTLHLARTPDTMNLIDADLLAKAKPGMRIVNVARGGIIDEAALAEAISNGPVGGAAIDVFAEEPTLVSPLFLLPEVTVTPHLGASTVEAQLKAGVQVAEQVALALAGEPVPFAVNAK